MLNATPRRRHGARLAAVWTLAWLSAFHLSAQDEPPLPSWTLPPMPSERRGEPGEDLLPLLPEIDLPDRFRGEPPKLFIDEDIGLDAHHLSLFLKGVQPTDGAATTMQRPPTPTLSLRPLPDALLTGLRSAPADAYLLDPQGLISELPRLDLERLLGFHAADAHIRLYLLVLDHDQKVAAGIDVHSFMQGELARNPCCLIIYPLGEPWRARFLLSRSIHDQIPQRQLTEMAEDCIEDAQKVVIPEAQLQRFTVRLSTRLHWLDAPLRKSARSTAPAPMREVNLQENVTSTLPGSSLESPALLWAALIAGVILCLALIQFHQRQRTKTDRRMWLLPDLEVPPRLGGSFSGGAGAMLSFKKGD